MALEEGVAEMELILFVEGAKAKDLEKKLLGDEEVSKANIILRDASSEGRQGFYVRVMGSEEQCKRAKILAEELAEEVTGEEREKILKAMKDEDERMLSGFSGIFD